MCVRRYLKERGKKKQNGAEMKNIFEFHYNKTKTNLIFVTEKHLDWPIIIIIIIKVMS